MIKLSVIKFVVLLALTTSAFAQKNSCMENINGLDVSTIEAIANYDGCTDKPTKKKRCKCIHEHISGKSVAGKDKNGNNSFVEFNLDQRIEKAEIEAAKITADLKAPYFNQHSEVYKLMTIQAAAQKTILKINDMDPAVGCSATEMAKGIKEKTEKTAEDLLPELKKLHEHYSKKSEQCNSKFLINLRFAGQLYGCEYFKNKANYISKKIDSLKNLKDQKEKENCAMAMRAFDNPAMKVNFEALSQYKSQIDFEGKILKNVANATNVLTNNMFAMLGSSLKVDVSTVVMKDIAQGNYKNVDTMIQAGQLNCTDFFSEVDRVQTTMDSKAEKGPAGGASIVVVPESLSLKSQCPDNDPVCLSFALKNRMLYKDAANIYKPDESSCLSYAEFVTMQGMPSEELLKDFAKARNPEDLLSSKNSSWLSSGPSKDKIKFLQNNPLIVQLAQNGKRKKELGQMLKKMSTDILAQKGDKSAGIKRYLDLMKSDEFNKMYRDSGSETSMAVCGELQRGFSAISLSDNFEDDSNDEDESSKDRQVYACVKRLHEDLNVSDLDKSINVSEIYNLSKDGAPKIPDYDEYIEKRDSYCNSANAKNTQEMKNAMNSRGVKRSLSGSDMGSMSAPYDRTRHDQQFINKYHEEVTSKMDQSALAMKGDSKAFEAQMSKNAEISSSSHVAEEYRRVRDASNSSFGTSVASKQFGQVPDGFEASKDASGQVRPQFESQNTTQAPAVTNFESIAPKKIQEANSMTDLDPSFNERPYEEKLSSYNALKDYASENGITPKFSPSEEIKELEKSLEESKVALEELEKNDVEKKEAKVAQTQSSSSGASRAPANFQQASFVAPISSAPVLGQFPGTRSVVGSEAKLSKAEASYQAALMQKYEMNQNLQIVVQGQDADVIAPYDIKSSNVLKSDDVYPFSSLNDPKKLSEFLAVKVGGNVKDGESVKIIDPATNSYFLLKATVKDGVTSYQRYPFVSEKDIRIVKLGDLHNTLKLNK